MDSSTDSAAAPPRFSLGQTVRTPSGAFGKIVAIYFLRQEAEVEWPNGESATFRLSMLRRPPGAPV